MSRLRRTHALPEERRVVRMKSSKPATSAFYDEFMRSRRLVSEDEFCETREFDRDGTTVVVRTN